jgi:hypothetical protein
MELHRLDAGVHRGVRRGIRCLHRVQQMLPGAAAGTEFQWRPDEDAVLRVRLAADAGDRGRMAHFAVAVRKAEKVLLPLEVRAAAMRDAALPGAAQRQQRERQRRALLLSALPSLQALRLSVPASPALRLAQPVEVRPCDGVMEPALRVR